ncbi:hypothetical protein ACFL1U_00650 [Patescibacteria group bacterium]
MSKLADKFKENKTSLMKIGMLSVLVILLGVILIQVEIPQTAVSQQGDLEDENQPIDRLRAFQDGVASNACETPAIFITDPTRYDDEDVDYVGQTYAYSVDLSEELASTANGTPPINFGGDSITYGEGSVYISNRANSDVNSQIFRLAPHFKTETDDGYFQSLNSYTGGGSAERINYIHFGYGSLYAQQFTTEVIKKFLPDLSSSISVSNDNGSLAIESGDNFIYSISDDRNSIFQFTTGVDNTFEKIKDVWGSGNNITAAGNGNIYSIDKPDTESYADILDFHKLELTDDNDLSTLLPTITGVINSKEISLEDIVYYKGFLYGTIYGNPLANQPEPDIDEDDIEENIHTYKIDPETFEILATADVGGESIIGFNGSIYVSSGFYPDKSLGSDYHPDLHPQVTYRLDADDLNESDPENIDKLSGIGGFLAAPNCSSHIEGHVFFDQNSNGQYDNGETKLPNPPIESVTIALLDEEGNSIGEEDIVITNNEGFFAFYDIEVVGGTRALQLLIRNHDEILGAGFQASTSEDLPYSASSPYFFDLPAESSIPVYFGYALGSGAATNTLTVEGEFIAPKVNFDR